MLRILFAGLLGINDHVNTKSKIKQNEQESKQRIARWKSNEAQINELHQKLENITIDTTPTLNIQANTSIENFIKRSSVETTAYCETDKKIIITWKSNIHCSVADGYELWRKCNIEAAQLISSITTEENMHKESHSKDTFTDHVIFEKDKFFTYEVKAYKYINGEKIYSRFSFPGKVSNDDIPYSYRTSSSQTSEVFAIPQAKQTENCNNITQYPNVYFPKVKPILLSVENISDTLILLKWEQLNNNILSYEIFRSSDSEKEHKIGGTDRRATSFSDKTPNAGIEYSYRIRAVRKIDSRKENSDFSSALSCSIKSDLSKTLAIESKDNDLTSKEKISDSNKGHNKLQDMDGHSFEKFCADVLRKNGFRDVVITKGSGDQGIDILAKLGGVKYGFQCKHYSSPVGNKAVQEVYSGKTFYNCHVGVVITNSTFTSSAIELADKNGVLLWNSTKLQKMINKANRIQPN